LKSLVAGVAEKRKVLLDFDRLAEGMVFTPEAARAILNLVLLAVESLPGGGVVVLCGNNEGSVLVTISGARAAWPTGLASWLLDEGAAWEAIGLGAHNVQGPPDHLTTLLVRENGFRLSMLMPAGAGGEAEALPPLLLELAGA
jgi:hypothetical protein